MPDLPATNLQLRSTVKQEGVLELSLARVPLPPPGEGEVVVRIEAAPLNPSDLALLFGGADMTTAKASGSGDDAKITASIQPEVMRMMAVRVGQSLPAGNEGAGTVI